MQAGLDLRKVEFIHGTNANAETMRANIATNLEQAERFACPTFTTRRALLVAGGPSANDHIEDIDAHYRDGWELWCVNGAHDWIGRHLGVAPHVCVMMDATEAVDKFVAEPLSGVTYLLASQTHPKLVKRMLEAAANVELWHAALDNDAHALMGDVTITAPANTVGLHTLQLMCLSGVRNVRIYGMDSSHRPNADHAYDNSHQNAVTELEFYFQGERFLSTGTWASQASLFSEMYPRFVKAGMRIAVVGDGLLPAMWRVAHERLIDDLTARKD